jgi:uncharacterized protein
MAESRSRGRAGVEPERTGEVPRRGATMRSRRVDAMDGDVPFWKRKRLAEMTAAEWESLCDGCGRCCLVKLEEEGTEDIYFTSVACRLLDTHGCRCRNYENRGEVVDDCVRLTPAVVDDIGWLPPTCAYRLVAEGKDLYWWHPLISGDSDTVHAAGVSVRDRVTALEDELPAEELENRIVDWPLRWPRRARRSKPPPR